MADEGWRLIAACRRRYLVSLLHRRSVRLLDARSHAREAEPIANRVMASIPEPLFGGRINVVQSYGPDTLAEAAVAGASKRTLPDTPLFGGRINVVQSYGPDTLAGAEKACL